MSDETVETQLDYWRPLSWSAIIFGALLALAVSVMLHILGLGLTASVVDTNSRASDALATVGGVSGIWYLISTAVALFVGGFVASTLARTFTNGRAAVYGLGVWALTTLTATAILVPALINGAGNTISAAGTVADRAASALGSAGNAATQAAQNIPNGVLDRVQRTLLGNPTGQVDQNAVQEITTLLGQRVSQGDWTPQQRNQLISAVARAANISQDDARRRVDEAQTTINNTLQEASDAVRRAAEVTRQAVAGAAYWAFASMLIGAIAALIGARYGELDEEDLPAFARMRFSRTTTSRA
jgi:ABC-type transport system involved in multi-copper enzyme maturation permease subunit